MPLEFTDSKTKNPLQSAAGKKWVTITGLVLVTLSFLCDTQRDNLGELLSPATMEKVCSAVGYLGGIIAALGKGLADRRNPRPDHYGLGALPLNGDESG